MKILAIYNIKDGIGKAAAVVNLDWLAERDGIPPLVWDFDPEASASCCFRVKPKARARIEGRVIWE